eukprot:CAMPEP_0184007122 /NCGR_PEP_ID=MMETSP0954-20121128/1130_1 /TAXON_ID=627963 /ORGANISM="Aplanochytrium sp, Strain PBS07" /LENGTH=456 /DNA_ID=CAMNT_0026285861 /DNA_START=48 /DNA_END=1418 /DNA_ORIENTATION=-
MTSLRTLLKIFLLLLCCGILYQYSIENEFMKVKIHTAPAQIGQLEKRSVIECETQSAAKNCTLNNENPFQSELLRSRPVSVCDDSIVFTAAFCTQEGICRVTGALRFPEEGVAGYRRVQSYPNLSGESIPTKLKPFEKFLWKISLATTSGKTVQANLDSIFFPGERVRQYDAFTAHYSLIQPMNDTIVELHIANCGKGPPMSLNVLSRKLALNGKTVLVISQFFTKVNLDWIKFYLSYNYGIDVIALYTTFDPQTTMFFGYDLRLNELLRLPKFRNHVVRFDFHGVKEKVNMHSRAQIPILNHAAVFFFGSTLLSHDLDELIAPLNSKSLKSILDELNKEYGSWSAIIPPYNVNTSDVFDWLTRQTVEDHHHISSLVRKSHECTEGHYPCRTKWIVNSLGITHLNIHFPHFFTRRGISKTQMIGKIPATDAVELHARHLQKTSFPNSSLVERWYSA